MKKNILLHSSDNERLDIFLREQLPHSLKNDRLSNSKIRRLILCGAVKVNGKNVTRPAFELRGKSEVFINFDSEKFFFEKQPEDIKFTLTQKEIVYEDEDFIFINKPAFFPVEQTITGNRANLHDALVDFLWSRNKALRNPPYAGIMHRLDRTTSGLILFTKNRNVNKEISDIFQSHRLTKKYYAVVERPENSAGRKNKSANGKISTVQNNFFPGAHFCVEMFMNRISKSSQNAKWGRVSEKDGGLYSKTEFSVVKEITIENKKCLLVECELFTGRTHQIRVHLAEEGIPILGDILYGGSKAERIYLHSAGLSFTIGEKVYDVKCLPDWESAGSPEV